MIMFVSRAVTDHGQDDIYGHQLVVPLGPIWIILIYKANVEGLLDPATTHLFFFFTLMQVPVSL